MATEWLGTRLPTATWLGTLIWWEVVQRNVNLCCQTLPLGGVGSFQHPVVIMGRGCLPRRKAH